MYPCGRGEETAFWAISRVLRECRIPLYQSLFEAVFRTEDHISDSPVQKEIGELEQGWWKANSLKRGLEYVTHEERLRETFCSALRRGGLMGTLSLSSVTQHEDTVVMSWALPRDAQ